MNERTMRLALQLLSGVLVFGLVACSRAVASRPEPAFAARDAVVAYRLPKTNWEGEMYARDAAADVAAALSQVTRSEIRLVKEEEVPADARAVIYVGDTAAAKAAGIDVATLGAVECRLKAEKGRAFIAARTGMGVNNGAMEFLERYADYWYVSFWGDDNPAVVNENLTIPFFDFTFRPAIRCREVYSGSHAADLKNFRRRQQQNPETFLRQIAFERRARLHAINWEYDPADRLSTQTGGCHTQFEYLPPEKYAKDHPDWYSMGEDGERHAVANRQSQICYTNPEVLDKVTEAMLGFIAADRKAHPTDYPRIYDFTQMDSCRRLCLCPDCKKVIAKYNRVKGGHEEGGDTALQLLFVNELARRVAKRYPDVNIRIFAYVSTQEYVEAVRPEPNVMIWLCDLYTRCDHECPLGVGELNAAQAKVLDDWAKSGANLELWDYMLMGPKWGGRFPEVNATALKSDAAFFRDRGVNRLFLECEFNLDPLWDLNAFLAGHLYLDPDRDVGQLLDAYCRLYGADAAAMRAALDYLIGRIDASKPATFDEWGGNARGLPWRNLETWRTFRGMIAPIWARTANPVTRARLADILLETDRELLPRLKTLPDAKAEYAEVRDEFRRCLKDFMPYALSTKKNRDKFREDAEGFLATLEVEFKDAPAVFKGLSSADSFSFDHHAMGERDRSRHMKPDEKSSTGLACLWKPKHAGTGVPCGVYDFLEKKTLEHLSFDLPADAYDYAWYRVGVSSISKGSIFYTTLSWEPNWSLDKYYRSCDGMDDVNRFEFWVSARRTESGEVRVDRMMMRRVK